MTTKIKFIAIFGVIVLNGFVLCSTSIIDSYLISAHRLNYNNNILYFNSSRVYEIIQQQVQLGPRYPGSIAIEKTRHLISSFLLPTEKWSLEYQNFSKKWIDNRDIRLVNIICRPVIQKPGEPIFLLLAHYDTRLWADKDLDPMESQQPVPGANDGASGVAVVLEIGRILVEYYNMANFQIIFFDAEDQGNIGGWDWLIGSKYYVKSKIFSDQIISFGILLDMVGAYNATFKREKFSDEYAGNIVSWIWNKASDLGYNNYFINKSGSKIIDDHVPLLEEGIPTIDIIDDFINRFKYWHTTEDNITHISSDTLEAVGYTLESAFAQTTILSEWMDNPSSFVFKTNLSIFGIISGFFVILLKRVFRKKKTIEKRKLC
jgi:glutaminyl-peptide cyclotransferase